jgi:hypothetical protein
VLKDATVLRRRPTLDPYLLAYLVTFKVNLKVPRPLQIAATCTCFVGMLQTGDLRHPTHQVTLLKPKESATKRHQTLTKAASRVMSLHIQRYDISPSFMGEHVCFIERYVTGDRGLNSIRCVCRIAGPATCNMCPSDSGSRVSSFLLACLPFPSLTTSWS